MTAMMAIERGCTMKMFLLVGALALSLCGPARAQPAAPMADGEVRKVDKQQGKLTLRHGPIASLDMPGMTMVFKVADPRMLDRLQPGDRVKFIADRIQGTVTVTAIEVVGQ
jgi:Cu/Ag efflux protein CusF